MTICRPPLRPYDVLALLLMLLALAALMGCSTTRPVPPAIEVKVPVPVPCVPVQVAAPVRPKATPGMSIFDLAKTALADRQVLIGDTERLRAANANPCPGATDAAR